jgi:hypothetical protein
MCFLDVNEVENYLINSKLINKTIVIKNKVIKTNDEQIEKMIKAEIDQKKDKVIDILDRCLQGKLSEYYRDIDLNFPDIQSKTREIKEDIRDNKFIFPYNLLPGKEMFKIIKDKIHSEYNLTITELEVANNFSENEIPKIIKEAILFFKK